MPEPDEVVASLIRASRALPDDRVLRVLMVTALLDAGALDQGIVEAASALLTWPADRELQQLMSRAIDLTENNEGLDSPRPDPVTAAEPGTPVDWARFDLEFHGSVPPSFVGDAQAQAVEDGWRAKPAGITLADVGGMEEVKARLETAFLAPLRNPELRELFGKQLRGGLLLFGPPGCGKTYFARAVAGELAASFLSVGITDVLDLRLGESERNIHALFEHARAQAPIVLFFDELDALGQRRSLSRGGSIRGAVNQLLTELDGIGSRNEGVFVIGATNQPWDIDSALRRPGRFDRTCLVLPPDRPAREAILRIHLEGRPLERIDLAKLAKQTEGLSGADLAYVCDLASEAALMASIGGVPRPITMRDLTNAASQTPRSTQGWLEGARNVVLYGAEDQAYEPLKEYLRQQRML